MCSFSLSSLQSPILDSRRPKHARVQLLIGNFPYFHNSPDFNKIVNGLSRHDSIDWTTRVAAITYCNTDAMPF